MRNKDLVSEVIDTSKAINTNWFATDVLYENHPQIINDASKHTLGIVVSASTIVNLMFTPAGAAVQTWALEKGNPLVADAIYYLDILMVPGDKYNIQHTTGTQNVTVRVIDTTRISIP